MKEVVVLIGKIGSGKTTYAKTYLPHHYYINQDLMGKAVKDNYLKALKNQNLIVVDRQNFSVEQREFYLKSAKEHAFKTRIIILNESVETCFKRAISRKDHPTIQQGDSKTILKVLNMFIDKYEEPKEEEADDIDIIGENTNYMLDLTEVCNDKRVILIGDPHACFTEVEKLLWELKHNPENDVVIFTGDLCDRGDRLVDLLEFCRKTKNVYSTRGNHDDKFLRWMLGAKVNLDLLQLSVDQTKDYIDESLILWFMSLPFIIKFDNKKFVTHAGINPKHSIYHQSKQHLLYIRNFNYLTNSMSDKQAPPWYSHPHNFDEHIFFGHSPLESYHASSYATSLDAGCCFGDALRGYVLSPDRKHSSFIEIPSLKAYADKKTYEKYVQKPLLELDDYVTKGLINKKIKGNLILYNYSDICNYEGAWDNNTQKCRGIIYDTVTSETVAYVMPKFWNLGEREETLLKNLPLEQEYVILDKLDGSMVSINHHKGELIVATRGSFESEQAKTAKSILTEKNYVEKLNPNLSYVAEVIYPENKMSPGAYLVVTYNFRDIVLLTAYDKTKDGKELTREELELEAKRLGCPICKEYKITIEEAIAQQSTLTVEREGFVVRFADSRRVKIKGSEYIKMHKLLNSINPLSTWSAMKNGKVEERYLIQLPEEVRAQVDEMKTKLESKYQAELDTIQLESALYPERLLDQSGADYFRTVGLWLKDNSHSLRYPSAVFPLLHGNSEAIEKLIMEAIRPTGNVLE